MFKRWLVGSPLPSITERHQRLSKTLALAVFSSDALSSVAYATEEVLLVLVLAGTSALILFVAANTSFADFPRLSSLLSRDGFLPRQLMHRGDRLVFSNGILALGVLAALLLAAFGGETHALIPLYAVGVFIAFTLSQAGMGMHWWHLREPGWRRHMAINAAGV